MSEPPQYGKVSRELFDQVIYPNLGAKRAEVIVGPSPGMDNCVLNIGRGEVMVATADPLSFISELGPKDSAWLSVNLIASDLSTSAFRPQYLILDFNLPPTFSDNMFESYWEGLHSECERLGAAVVGGHTGRFQGIESTVIGGGVMFSVGSSKSYLTSSMGEIGDKILITKGAAVATTGILARVFPETVREAIGEKGVRAAQGYFEQISTVKDALLASAVGLRSAGVSAMHDCTEGGVLTGIYELVSASKSGALVEREKIPLSGETKELCRVFGIDPYVSLGEGALVISCVAVKANEIMKALQLAGIESAVVGELKEESEGIVISEDGREKKFDRPESDPYWAAYYHAKEKGWK